LRYWLGGQRRGRDFEIAERDDGYISALDVAHYFPRAEMLAPLDQWACERARGRVLDVGCGSGRHALPLQGRGHEVVAIDPSPGAVRVARLRGVDAVEAGIDDVADLGTFNTALLMGNNLGLLGGAERGRQVLALLATAVRPGGILIGSSVDPATETGPEHAEYQALNRGRGRMPGQLTIRVRDRCVSSPWFDYLQLSVAELRVLTAGTPWSVVASFDGPIGYAAMLLRTS
jgi:SAM-dependent methyltransferase